MSWRVLLGLFLALAPALARAQQWRPVVVSPFTGKVRPLRVPAGFINLRGINPAGVAAWNNNCVKAAIATDLNAKGIPAIALPQLQPSGPELVTTYGLPRFFRSALEVAAIAHLEGPGYMGIVTADVAGQGIGHAFNVQNVGGTVQFLDGQIGSVVTDLSRFSNFRLYDTH